MDGYRLGMLVRGWERGILRFLRGRFAEKEGLLGTAAHVLRGDGHLTQAERLARVSSGVVQGRGVGARVWWGWWASWGVLTGAGERGQGPPRGVCAGMRSGSCGPSCWPPEGSLPPPARCRPQHDHAHWPPQMAAPPQRPPHPHAL